MPRDGVQESERCQEPARSSGSAHLLCSGEASVPAAQPAQPGWPDCQTPGGRREAWKSCLYPAWPLLRPLGAAGLTVALLCPRPHPGRHPPGTEGVTGLLPEGGAARGHGGQAAAIRCPAPAWPGHPPSPHPLPFPEPECGQPLQPSRPRSVGERVSGSWQGSQSPPVS